MTARQDYPFPAAVADGRVNGGAYGRQECAAALDEIDRLRDYVKQLLTELSNYSMGGRVGSWSDDPSIWLCPNGCDAAYAIRCSVCNTLVRNAP